LESWTKDEDLEAEGHAEIEEVEEVMIIIPTRLGEGGQVIFNVAGCNIILEKRILYLLPFS